MVSPEPTGPPGYPWPDMGTGPTELLVSLRFRAADAVGVLARLREAVAVLSGAEGFVGAWIGRSTDDADLLVLAMRWASVGAYRRALSPVHVRTTVVPILSSALDEPSAFEVVHRRDAAGVVESTGSLAADADEIGLGDAAGPWIAPAPS